MTSLTETAFYARRSIKWLILAIVGYIVLKICWTILFSVWLTFFPPKPPPPTTAFGKLPTVKFPVPQASPSGELIFRLDTISGSVPRASESGTVYFMPKNPANLLALNKAQVLANRFDLDPTPLQENKNIYRFSDPSFPLRRLRYDIVSNNFILRYSFELDTGLFAEREIPNSESAIAEAKSLLQTYGLYKEDFAQGRTAVSYLKLSGSRLVKTSSLSQADGIRIDFFRKNIQEMQVLSPSPEEAPISFIYSGSRNQAKRLLQVAYTYWPIDYQTLATYPLKSSTMAWQELQSGGGYIARYPRSGREAVIRTLYLAYYDSFEPQMYLQPIFVFEGDNGFMAYVPAVSPEWVE